MTPALEIDLSGLNCPLPILRAKKALATLHSDDLLAVICTDPATPTDFAAFCRQTGNELVESATHDGKFHFLIKKR
ncbi:sulfurtransferase TusA family protein [Chitiniphilus eburneus]|uniref:Sulfurtransferase TusA family protein n=1 Tax=Chitiniphilus eburneus TaxID=2571148 RepID=A0A4U0QAK1_9NEIS|nr:sulfurtransferase TusA family protein [Chitiniphilus eburneus]TJZ77452.1 sulfurtransferase TusA family protein [Chitiniphilus eburneus]